MLFSARARDAMRRRRGVAALGAFLRESGRDARAAQRAHRSLVDAGVRFSLGLTVFLLLVILALSVLRVPGDGLHLAAGVLASGLAAVLAVAAGAGMLARRPGEVTLAPARAGLGAANALTLARIVLIGPAVALLAQRQYTAALVVYLLLVASDVADGAVARARRDESEFGVVMDPLADVASTYAVFTVFAVDNLVPVWLYLVLTVRYAMLLAGSVGFFLLTGGIEFRATVPGKVVGVVQAAGAAALIVIAGGARVPPAVSGWLFAFLGLGFASIVVSQARWGWVHMRRAEQDMR